VVSHRQLPQRLRPLPDSDSNAECNAHRNIKAYSDAEVSSHGSAASHAAGVKENGN
jgi:hypothetical protein